MNIQMFKLYLEKAEEPEIKLSTSAGSSKKQESSKKKIYFCFIDYAQAFSWITTNCGKFLEMRIPDHLPFEKLVCRSRSNSQNWTWNKRLVPNRDRSMSRLYIITLLI